MSSSVFKVHQVYLLLAFWITDRIHSAHYSLDIRDPGCFVFFACSTAPRYYTTASASPATTSVPTTTAAVSTTVKSSVLVGNEQSLINTESKGGIFI